MSTPKLTKRLAALSSVEQGEVKAWLALRALSLLGPLSFSQLATAVFGAADQAARTSLYNSVLPRLHGEAGRLTSDGAPLVTMLAGAAGREVFAINAAGARLLQKDTATADLAVRTLGKGLLRGWTAQGADHSQRAADGRTADHDALARAFLVHEAAAGNAAVFSEAALAASLSTVARAGDFIESSAWARFPDGLVCHADGTVEVIEAENTLSKAYVKIGRSFTPFRNLDAAEFALGVGSNAPVRGLTFLVPHKGCERYKQRFARAFASWAVGLVRADEHGQEFAASASVEGFSEGLARVAGLVRFATVRLSSLQHLHAKNGLAFETMAEVLARSEEGTEQAQAVAELTQGRGSFASGSFLERLRQAHISADAGSSPVLSPLALAAVRLALHTQHLREEAQPLQVAAAAARKKTAAPKAKQVVPAAPAPAPALTPAPVALTVAAVTNPAPPEVVEAADPVVAAPVARTVISAAKPPQLLSKAREAAERLPVRAAQFRAALSALIAPDEDIFDVSVATAKVLLHRHLTGPQAAEPVHADEFGKLLGAALFERVGQPAPAFNGESQSLLTDLADKLLSLSSRVQWSKTSRRVSVFVAVEEPSNA